jgi:hypothetical protein
VPSILVLTDALARMCLARARLGPSVWPRLCTEVVAAPAAQNARLQPDVQSERALSIALSGRLAASALRDDTPLKAGNPVVFLILQNFIFDHAKLA